MRRITIKMALVCLIAVAGFFTARTLGDRGAPTLASNDEPTVTISQQRELERLATLGYIDGRGPAPESSGVLVHDTSRTSAGPTLFTFAKGPEAVLIGMDGVALHSWNRPGSDYWARAHAFPNGDLIAITCDPYRLIKINADSELLWTLELQAHHDFHMQEDGSLWVLVRVPVKRDAIHGGSWLLDDALVHVDAGGRELGRVSILEAFERTPEHRSWVEESRLPEGPDIFHTNSVEIVDGGRRALVSARALGAIVMLDLHAGTVEWIRTGEWRMQHEAQLINGHLLLFDNSGLGEQSRVLEIDLSTGETVWSYTAPGFYTRGAGAQQRLPGGNTLITESERGRIIEVTSAGDIVWEFVNPRTVPDRPETILGIMRAERLLDGLTDEGASE